jgi:hypothetical protein
MNLLSELYCPLRSLVRSLGLSPVCVVQICETKDYGKRYGTISLVIGIVALVVVPLPGAIPISNYDKAEEQLSRADLSSWFRVCVLNYICFC